MANRTIQQKIRKLKRYRRFARFSGETSKFVKSRNTGIIGSDGKEIYVPVGPIHPSKQVPKGKGPNQERMQEYYGRVKAESFLEPLQIRSGSDMVKWLEKYINIINETPIENRITLAQSKTGRMDLFFVPLQKEWFFVELNYTEEYIRRSRVYDSRATAFDRLKNGRIMWVETMRKEE